MGAFGLVAALAGWRSGWNATALPPAAKSPMTLEEDAEKRYPAEDVDPDFLQPPVGLDAGLDEI